MIADTDDLQAPFTDLDLWTRAELIAEINHLRTELADKDRFLCVARAAIDEGLSAGGAVVSLPQV